MITKVKLKDWRSHADSELSFSAGTNALVGILGSGKTSILDAICFALFGTFPTLQMRKLKLEDIIMKKPERKDRAEVEVELAIDGSNYLIRRAVERGKGTTHSELRKDGELLESPSTQLVTELVEKILKVNYELFSKAIYAEQNSLDYFLTLGKGQRMKKMDELLMIDKFEKARAAAVALANKIAERMVGKESVLRQTNVEDLKKTLEETKASVQKSAETKVMLEDELEEMKKRKSDLEKEVAELRKIDADLQLLKRQESGINSAIEETKRIVAELQKVVSDANYEELPIRLGELSAQADESNKTLKERQKEYEQLSNRVAESKSKMEFLRMEKIERLEDEIEEKLQLKKKFEHLRDATGENVEEQLSKKNKLYNELVSELAEFKAKINNLQDVLATLSTTVGKCPVCDSQLSEEKRKLLMEKKELELAELKEKIDDVEKRRQLTEEAMEKIKSAAEQMKELLAEIKDFGELQAELESSRLLLKQHSEAASALGVQLSELKDGIENMREELDKTANNKQQLQLLQSKMKDYQEREQRLKELMEQREQLKQHLSAHESKIEERELEKLESWLKNAIAKERELETRIVGINDLTIERQERTREYEAALQQLEKDKAEVARLAALIKELKIFTEALKQTQVQLRENFVTAVNMRMAELWQTLYPYQDFVGIQLAVEEGDYVLQLQERSGAWVNVEGVASGGERSIACLTMRIAFSLVLAPQLNLLFLDEPTENLDAAAVSVLARTLRENIGQFIDQCFIITHNEALEEAVTGNAYRLERDKGKDEATKIVTL